MNFDKKLSLVRKRISESKLSQAIEVLVSLSENERAINDTLKSLTARYKKMKRTKTKGQFIMKIIN